MTRPSKSFSKQGRRTVSGKDEPNEKHRQDIRQNESGRRENLHADLLRLHDRQARGAAGINAILVGDSLGNVMLGYPDTLSVTMEDMITYGRAVARKCLTHYI